MSYIFLIIYVLLTSSGLILLKLGTTNGMPISIVEHAIKFNFNLYSLLGFFLYGCSFLLYIYLISILDLGFVLPVTTALIYILIFTASYFIFHEVFTVMKVVSITLIVFGVVLLNLNK